jgi:HAMP domain-containing protein
VRHDRRRTLVLAVVAAVLFGFVFGWFARLWIAPSTGERARDRLGELRERAREFTR